MPQITRINLIIKFVPGGEKVTLALEEAPPAALVHWASGDGVEKNHSELENNTQPLLLRRIWSISRINWGSILDNFLRNWRKFLRQSLKFQLDCKNFISRILLSIVRTFLHWKWCWNILCAWYMEGSWERGVGKITSRLSASLRPLFITMKR